MTRQSLPSGPVLVVGGGIGGMAAALALTQAGFEVDLFEQAPEIGEIGAGIQLGPNAFAAADALGCGPSARARAVYNEELVMMDAVDGEPVARMPVGQAFRDRFANPYAVIHRADIHLSVYESVRGQPGVRLHPGTRVDRVEIDDTGVALIDAAGRAYRGAALIGADGLWSAVRQAIVGDGAPRVSGHVAYRAVLPADDVPKHLFSPDVVLWGGEKTHLVHYPLRRGELFNLVAVFHSNRYEEGWNIFGDPHELHERFAEAVGPVRELLGKIETWKMWVLCDREPVSNWSQGRVTLLGDAAHPMLQYLAQGACMAIEDAAVLGVALERANGDFAAAFQDYQRVRYLRTGRVQLTARFYGDIYHASGVTRELRNQLFQSGTESAGFAGLKWLYQGVDPKTVFA